MSCFCSVIYSNFNISQYLIENFFTHITSFNSFKEYSEVLKNVLAVVENDPGCTQNFDIFFDNFSHFIKLIYDHSKNENLPYINYTFQFLIENYDDAFREYFIAAGIGKRTNKFAFLKNNFYLKNYLNLIKDSKACLIS